jgi:lipoprotein-anchoring transpeptidase ErfK/SrfK
LSIIEPEIKANSKKKDPKEKVEKPKKIEKTPILKRHHKIIMASCAFLIVVTALVALIGGGVYAHQAMYENKVFPGVVVWGEDAGGKSMAEVQAMITEKIKSYEITLRGPDQDYKATAEDLGVIYDSETMALAAFSRGRASSALENYLTRARLLATKIPVDFWQDFIRANDLVISPSFSVNEDKFNTYVSQVAENIKITAQDSELNVSSGQIHLRPAIYGREVQLDALKAEVRESIAGFDLKEITIETVQIKPAIIDDAAQEVMIQAQNVMQRPVVLSYQGTEYRPNQETVASWISFVKKTGDTKYTLVVDVAKMKNYFDFLGTKINVYPISRKIRVENGVKETEIRPGVKGNLIDTALLGKTISEQLPNQASVATTIPTYIADFKTEYERVVIANWDKYIDINLSTQTMTACEKNGVNCRQWLVTTGDDNHPTPTGTFLVLGRNASFYMSGGTPGVDYYKVWVDRAVWFTSAGHAIHDAEWRNGVFGGQDYHWNGSHGCINSPDDAPTFNYNRALVGTPVIVHY